MRCEPDWAPCHRVVFEEGGRTYAWAVPIAPLLTIVSSGHSVGPLWGYGSTKVVVWYGIGRWELLTFMQWIA